MTTKHKTGMVNKKLTWVLAILIPIIGYLTYSQLWYKPKEVNSNIFKLNKVLIGHGAGIWSVKFSPDGKIIASGSIDSTIKLWTSNGELIRTIKQPEGITSLAFSPDGNYLVTSSYDAKLRLYKMPEAILIKEFTGHVGTVWSICFSSDSKTIASCGDDKSIKTWDIASGQLLQTLTGHTLNIWDIKFSPDGKQLASGSFDKSIKIWDPIKGKLLHTLYDHTEAVVALAFSNDGKTLASTSDDKTIKLWDTRNWGLIRSIEVPEHAQAVAFSPDDKTFLTGGRDKIMLGELLQNFFGDSHYNKGVSTRLWDVATGTLLQTFAKHANDVNDVDWSPDGKQFASASADNTVEIWNLSEEQRK